MARLKVNGDLKFKMMLEMVRGVSASDVGEKYGIKTMMLARWMKVFTERGPLLFNGKNMPDDGDSENAEVEELKGNIANLKLIIADMAIESHKRP